LEPAFGFFVFDIAAYMMSAKDGKGYARKKSLGNRKIEVNKKSGKIHEYNDTIYDFISYK